MLGALLLVAWGLLAYATGLLRVPRALRLLLATTLLGLLVMIWSYAAPQPLIQVSGVRLLLSNWRRHRSARSKHAPVGAARAGEGIGRHGRRW